MLKGQKGITLVALVITIIVLLILAGVTISMVLNGGILDKAQEGTQAYSDSAVREQIDLGLATVQADYYNPQTKSTVTNATAGSSFKTYIESVLDGAEVTTTTASAVTVKYNGKTWTVNLDVEATDKTNLFKVTNPSSTPAGNTQAGA